jgi:hypothetical protein
MGEHSFNDKEENAYDLRFGKDPREYDKFNELMREIDQERGCESLSHMPGYTAIDVTSPRDRSFGYKTIEWKKD